MTPWKWFGLVLLALLVSPAGAQAQPVGWGMVVDAQGQIFFCDLERNTVWKRDLAGRLTPIKERNHCHSLTIDADGNIYGEQVGFGSLPDSGKLALWKITPGGKFSYLMMPTERPPQEFSIYFDRAGNRYAWAGDRDKNFSQILKRAPSGEVGVLAGREWGSADGSRDEARFGSVGALAAGPDGSLYLTDSGNLRRVAPDGSVTTLGRGVVSDKVAGVPNQNGMFNHSMGMTVDAAGNVYIVDRGPRHVLRLSPDGRWTRFPSPWLRTPSGVAVAGNDFYIMELWPLPRFASELVGNPRIRRISADGEETTVVAVASTPARAGTAVLLAVIVAGVVEWRRKRRSRGAAPLQRPASHALFSER